MIPVKLTLEGIYSYQKRQTIDFTSLTDGGLFGIFGAVASGKSTILEAISFALYGDSDRMGGSNRNYNMMNLKSDKMYIDFEFLNFENKKYRAIREYRRNSRNFNDVRLHDTTFYQWSKEEWIPLDHTNAETIIGLSATNFKRTIIIPQGKFREFIELRGTERTNMMKELFNLHHYDLYGNARSLYNSNNIKMNTLEGKLSGYDDISKKVIAEKKKQYSEQNEAFENKFAKHKKLSEAFELLKQLNEDFNALQKQKKKLADKDTHKKEIEKQEESLKLYVTTFQAFDEVLRLQKQLEQRIESQNNYLNNTVKELNAKKELSKEIADKLEKIKPFIDLLEIKKQEVADLEHISNIITYEAEIKKGEQRTTKGKEIVKNLTKEVEEYTNTINNTEKQIEQINTQLIDAKIITAIELWFYNYNALLKQLDENKKKLKENESELAENKNKFKELNYSKTDWKKKIEEENKLIKKQADAAKKQQTQLQVKQELAQFADKIQQGAACPLCGSFEHPKVIEIEDVGMEILNNKKELARLENATQVNTTNNLKLTRLEDSYNTLEKSKAEINNKLAKLKEELNKHIALFEWEYFSYKNEIEFKAKKEKNDKLNTEKRSLEEKQKKNRIQLEQASKKLTDANELLATIEDRNKENSTRINATLNHIKLLKKEDYEHLSVEGIEDLKAEKKKLINDKQEEYLKLEKQYNELQQTIAAQEGTKKEIEKQLNNLHQEQNENNTLIDNKLTKSGFDSIEDIVLLLKNKRNVEDERAFIEGFKIEYAQLKHSIEELKKRLEGKSFSIETYNEKQKEFQESEKEVNSLRETLATLRYEVDRIKEEYKKKKELLAEKEQLESRKENISTLLQLFTASGFVNYVSGIYLNNLCAIANERFHRLTKNQLSLQINDKNEFEIIDYLNDGRTRSVRTLSGGQSFQVSLSLALALAENVQSLTNAEKNFFFIDEGFGTQDSESVNIVFETLNNLQKGNRIVGIISHVEELQERIPKSLYIRNDLEKGSIIETIE